MSSGLLGNPSRRKPVDLCKYIICMHQRTIPWTYKVQLWSSNLVQKNHLQFLKKDTPDPYTAKLPTIPYPYTSMFHYPLSIFRYPLTSYLTETLYLCLGCSNQTTQKIHSLVRLFIPELGDELLRGFFWQRLSMYQEPSDLTLFLTELDTDIIIQVIIYFIYKCGQCNSTVYYYIIEKKPNTKSILGTYTVCGFISIP